MCIRPSGLSIVAAAGLLIGVSALPAAAQNALGDGTGLDRNLRQGSQGRNERGRDIRAEMRFQNAIITGNAPGGKSFHGEVGYLAADEIRAQLGSNDLFEYYRDSSTSSLPSLGIRGTDALRYQYSMATGSAPPPQLAGSFTLSRSQAGATGGQIGGLRSTADYLTQRESRKSVIGVRQQPDGRQIAVTASPLLGIREVTLAANTDGGSASASPDTPVNPQMPTTPSPGETGAGAPSTRPAAGWQFTGMEAVPRGVPRPGTRIDQMETAAPSSKAVEFTTKTHDQVLTQFKDEFEKGRAEKPGVKSAPAEKPEAGGSPAIPDAADWRARLDEMRAQLQGGKLKEKPGAKKPADEPAKPADAKPTPEEESRARAEQFRADREKREAQRKLLQQGLDEEALRAIKKTRPKVTDLTGPVSGNDSLAYADQMVGGQAALADGKYFDAEERFTRALAAIPGDPMAQIGRVHAQVASGLYMSAAVNLRSLMADHPELAGTRYGEKLLPKGERWAAIKGQLTGRLGADDVSVADASGLLLAYMGYQFSDADAVRDGLAEIDKHTADDPSAKKLAELLRAVWSEVPDPSK